MATMRANRGGIERLRSKLAAVQLTDADKAGPLLIVMDQEAVRQNRRMFATEGAFTGTPWAALSPRYAAYKRKVKPGRRKLVFEGDTKDSFLTPTNPNHYRKFVPPFTYLLGATGEKAWRHNTGTGVGKQRLPVRRLNAKTPENIKAFYQAVAGYYIKHVRRVLR